MYQTSDPKIPKCTLDCKLNEHTQLQIRQITIEVIFFFHCMSIRRPAYWPLACNYTDIQFVKTLNNRYESFKFMQFRSGFLMTKCITFGLQCIVKVQIFSKGFSNLKIDISRFFLIKLKYITTISYCNFHLFNFTNLLTGLYVVQLRFYIMQLQNLIFETFQPIVPLLSLILISLHVLLLKFCYVLWL